ncbi:MAG: hypothetical protein CMC57_05945 [Flavobacteriaceae bacterium]|nr:hypothetical protein [Flavobacteriaceae bacterium]|tara:strand:+ start:83 stop:406 length:324 start_codon:yes stop_codon:yes gene_type:complete
MFVLDIVVVLISLIYVLVGWFTNENNARHLFAGYREMSESERKQYDIKAILKFFKPFILNLGIFTMFAYFSISFLFDYITALFVWIGIETIALAYLVVKLNEFKVNE